MIRLVGPGGAGKTTVGLALADRLRMPFIDLDERFTAHAGDISAFLSAHGYPAYAKRNVEVYLDVLETSTEPAVFALSSGFMTYADDAHPEYARLRREILTSRSTVALLPSFDYETCVAETVRRQARRSFSRSAAHEEHVIRTRFAVYRELPLPTFETMAPIDDVVDDLVTLLSSGTSTPRAR
jgi:shikimate kinase